MSRVFFAEKAARASGQPWPPAINMPVVVEPQREPSIERREMKIEANEIEMASQTSLPPDSDSGESGDSSAEESDRDEDVKMPLVCATDAAEWKKLKRLERETIETLQQIQQRLHAIEHRVAVEFRNVPPASEDDDVLLTIEFTRVGRLMIAEDGRKEADVSSEDYVMRNGLRLRFSQSILEIRGAVQDVAGFQISTIGVPFRIAISAASIDIDERFRLSKDGLLMRASDANALPAITRHELTLGGPEQTVIRIQYRGFRYELDCTGNRLTMRPESGTVTAPVTEEID